MFVSSPSLQADVQQTGFRFVEGEAMRALFETFGPLSDWAAFADSWNALEPDAYLANVGLHRRRRHVRRRTARGRAPT